LWNWAQLRVTVAVYHVRRDIVYGLNFYRNQPIIYYSQKETPIDMQHQEPPSSQHIVIAPQGSYKEVQEQVGQRAVASIGEFSSPKAGILPCQRRKIKASDVAGSYWFGSKGRYRL